MNRLLLRFIAMIAVGGAMAQPKYDMKHLQHESLNRGVVAIRQDDGKIFVSWRTLTSDKKGESFDVFRDGVKLNKHSLTKGGTFFIDDKPENGDALYEVRGGVINGQFTFHANQPAGYLPIKIERPADGITPDGKSFTYSANDASIGDVDGDGQYEIFLKWEPSNAKDNSFSGYTGNIFIDCYTMAGKRLWRVDLGHNIRSGAHYTPFIVYDFDGDGCAEMMMKTADGTTDGTGNVIGDADKDWRCHEEGKLLGHIMDGPEYLTVFNGATGKAMNTVNYVPDRGENGSWGDKKANRSERYLAAVGYLDGIHASAIFCRGYYARSVIAAWDWDGKQLRQHWIFDTNTPEWNGYAGQGNHNLRVADVDGDGCDEITYGSMAVDNDGRGLYNTGLGHGDAMHLTVFDTKSNKLQVWDCHEKHNNGSDFRDAATGKILFHLPANGDVGRCMAADIDPTNPGVEMWSSASGGIRNIKGELVVPKNPTDNYDQRIEEYWRQNPPMPNKADTAHAAASRHRLQGMSTNFGIWWDGDLLRELLDHEMVIKYDWNSGQCNMVKHFDGCKFNNWTKSNPCLSADIIGDWREEVLTRNDESTELRLYVSTIPTDYRINCLEEDIPYRLSVATENVAYNQPPETGFYLGPDKTKHPFLK
jgi:rhamnogalacturonan endolyase